MQHAHRLLNRGFARALTLELVTRNVVSLVKPPPVPDTEIQILTAPQITELLQRLRRANNPTKRRLFPIVAVALNLGLRRGEILAARWRDVDLSGRIWRVERSLEETAAGLRFKSPKTRAGRRVIEIGEELARVIEQRKGQMLAHRVMFGLGRLTEEDLIVANPMGEALAPDTLSRDWGNVIRDFHSLPPVSFHALRHTRASMLIAGGMNVVDVAYQLRHGSPATTLRIYAHWFGNRGAKQAAGIADDMMRGLRDRLWEGIILAAFDKHLSHIPQMKPRFWARRRWFWYNSRYLIESQLGRRSRTRWVKRIGTL